MASNPQHQELLRKYAEAIVKVGLNLRAGQRLIITNAVARGVPPAGRPLVHEVTKAAYAAGARFVDVIWGDEEMLRIRLQNAPADSFHEYPKWHVNGILDMLEKGDALLSIYANDPDVYSGLDSERVGAMQKSHLENYSPISALVSRNDDSSSRLRGLHPHSRTAVLVTSERTFDRNLQIVCGGVLQHERGRAGAERGSRDVLITASGHEHHLDLR